MPGAISEELFEKIYEKKRHFLRSLEPKSTEEDYCSPPPRALRMYSYRVAQTVETPYGVSSVIDIRRDDIVVCEPISWLLATGRPPRFFMRRNDLKPLFNVGDEVSTTYGFGKIHEIRQDSVHLVRLSEWRLADGKSPTLYLQENALAKMKPTIADSDEIDKRLAGAAALKEEANALFAKSDYRGAQAKYLDILDLLHESMEGASNEQRACVFENSVPCHNNIALCCSNLAMWSESISFANNALILINALEDRKSQGGSEVWNILVSKRGLTVQKLQDWKKKSHFIMGKGFLAQDYFQQAVSSLEVSLALTDRSDPKKIRDANKIREMISIARRKRAAVVKKEKATWSRVFEGSAKEGEKRQESDVGNSDASNNDLLRDSKEKKSKEKDIGIVRLPFRWNFSFMFFSLASIAGLGFLFTRYKKW